MYRLYIKELSILLLPGQILRKTNLTLKNKALLSLIFLCLIGIISITAIFQTIAHNEITLIEQQVIKEKGETVVAGIEQYLSSVDRLVQNMAKLAADLPNNKKIYHKVFPRLLGNDDFYSHIAGGGIWPEPYNFDKTKKRSSFFWGREQNGQLKFYNDYNLETGKGYHNEEWYVPARYLHKNGTYWSRSYMDPYSFESMVTATAAYKDKSGKFSGVTTVDVKLSGLNKLFSQHSEEIQGYIFAVDRSDVFLSFPEISEIKPYATDKQNKPVGQFFTLDRFVENQPEFSVYANHIKNKRNVLTQQFSDEHAFDNLSAVINKESYQISDKESKRIALDLKIQAHHTHNHHASLLYVTNDPVLKKDAIASLYYLPEHHWFVAVVTPREIMMSKVQHTTTKIFFWILLAASLLFILAFYIFSKVIINPIKLVGSELEKNIHSGKQTPLPVVSNDELGQLVTLFNERTEMLEKSRIEADTANNAKSDFLSRMSHELRTPLNAILGFSQLLEMDKNIDKTNLENAREIHKAGKHLLVLVNDLIDISRIESNINFLIIQPCKLKPIIKDSLSLIKPIQEKFNISIDNKSGDCADIDISADKTAVKQILINLISNAIKYNSDNGSVSINCQQNDSYVSIQIEDTGVGMSEKNINEIFEPFNRIANEYTGIEGAGIGLYITKKLIEQMQGTIKVKSTPGVGSTFIIGLPVSIVKSIPDSDSIIEIVERNTNINSGIKILVVEDIISNQKVIQQQLKAIGFNTDIANNGQEALDLLTIEKYDLVLTDCAMPVMDGYELTKKIRASKHRNLANIPIIAITANASIEIEEICLNTGMDDYISKPVDLNLLNEKIQKQLS